MCVLVHAKITVSYTSPVSLLLRLEKTEYETGLLKLDFGTFTLQTGLLKPGYKSISFGVQYKTNSFYKTLR